MLEVDVHVALVATVHDPDKHLYSLTEGKLPELKTVYAALVLACSSTTHPAILALLQESGAKVYRETTPPGWEGLGRVRKGVLRAGLETEYDHFHLCDFDRALHWVAHYPHELRQVVRDIADHDFLIMGRTARAFATHPPVQMETERAVNVVFSKVFGREADITGGSRGLSRQAVEVLLEHSREEGLGVDAEWPLIVRRFSELRLGYRACEGLEFETGDGREEEIARAGGLKQWKEDVLGLPEAWVHRLKIAHEIAAAAVRARREFISRSFTNS